LGTRPSRFLGVEGVVFSSAAELWGGTSTPRAFAFGLDRSTGVAFLTDDNSGGDNGGCGAESGDGGEGDPVAGARTSPKLRGV